jgi:inner membrane protein
VVGDADSAPSHLQPQRVLANPDPFDPFRWHLVTDFGDFYQQAEVDLRNESVTPAQDIHAKPERTAAVLAAMASPIGRAYMDWSPMPWITESKPGDPTRASTDDAATAGHTLVTFRDPRLMLDLPFFRNRAEPPLTAVVELDAQNRVVRQTMDGSVQR